MNSVAVKAKVRRRREELPKSIAQRIGAIRAHAGKFARESEASVRSIAEGYRQELAQQHDDSNPRRRGFQPEQIDLYFGLAVDAVRRVTGYELYDVQLMAALTLSTGAIAEMQTGEGKTLSATPAAIFRGLCGHGVHMVTTNAYLAERDCEIVRPACEILGLSVGCLKENASPEQTRAAYQCDVTYGTGYAYGFDFLRDQLTQQRMTTSRLGDQILQRLRGRSNRAIDYLQRGLKFSVVDEVDHVFLDEANSPLILSEQSQREAPDAEAYRMARRQIAKLSDGEDYVVDRTRGFVELTAQGVERVHQADVSVPTQVLKRSWQDYITSALRAEQFFLRDVHYILRDGQVQLVDGATGRIFADRSWQDGLHQAVEAKEGLTISADKNVLAQITRQRFYRLYSSLAGMTGTGAGFEREFRQVYRLRVVPIPPRLPSQRQAWPMRFFVDQESKYEAIARDIATVHQTRRPILIGTRTIAESEKLADYLQASGLSYQVLNGKQDAEEADVISRAGEGGAITVATNMAGRGTDIKMTPAVKALGGLHVVVAEPDESGRVDRQLVGRAGRQGDPGSSQKYISADDELMIKHGDWLARTLRRLSHDKGEVHSNLEATLQRLQRSVERRKYAARVAMLRQDLRRDENR